MNVPTILSLRFECDSQFEGIHKVNMERVITYGGLNVKRSGVLVARIIRTTDLTGMAIWEFSERAHLVCKILGGGSGSVWYGVALLYDHRCSTICFTFYS